MISRLWDKLTEHIDTYLFSVLTVFLVLGLMVLYSASGEDFTRVSSQAAKICGALVLMWAIANLPPQRLMQFAVPLYLLGISLLVGVALFGEVTNGARRWLNLHVVRLQPSEIMKIAVPLMLAWYFEKHEATLRIRDYGVALIILAMPVALIVKQPDLGTALLISASGFYVLFLAGLSWKIMLTSVAAGAASLPVVWSLLHDYQRQRILTLIDPSQDPLGAGYHTIQSSIALGSGGFIGKGWLHGSQAHLDFLPERHTDFIFAVFGEEFGLLGNFILLMLYLVIIGRGMVIAANAPTFFTRLMAGSITLTFFTYAFVNMGMVSGILPVVGVPLPLVSYGGTSMVTLMIGFGILMSIGTHRKLVST
jgi:rod shape determining protein RodA